MKVKVTLSEEELTQAVTIGAQRNIASLMNNYQQPREQTQKETHWEWHIVGAIAELAVAKTLDVEWHCDTSMIHKTDCGKYQVRTTADPRGTLKVRRRDNPSDIFIFTQVHKHKVLIHGWTTGQRVIDYGDEMFPNCFTIPTELLYPIQDLNEAINWGNGVEQHIIPRKKTAAQ